MNTIRPIYDTSYLLGPPPEISVTKGAVDIETAGHCMIDYADNLELGRACTVEMGHEIAKQFNEWVERVRESIVDVPVLHMYTSDAGNETMLSAKMLKTRSFNIDFQMNLDCMNTYKKIREATGSESYSLEQISKDMLNN